VISIASPPVFPGQKRAFREVIDLAVGDGQVTADAQALIADHRTAEPRLSVFFSSG
jgi:hypothetical protein